MPQNKKTKKVVPYGLWSSQLDIAELFSQPSVPAYPFRKNKTLYWLEALPEEKGRVALMKEEDGEKHCVLPAPLNIRSQVHEYGGCCFCTIEEGVVFNNFSDGHLYFLNLKNKGDPVRLTQHPPEVDITGYADLTVSPNNDVIIAVCEQIRQKSTNKNFLAALPINLNAPEKTTPIELVEGTDFYCSPCFSDDGEKLAWIEWDNPFMPWDQSRLCHSRLRVNDDNVELVNREILIDQPDRTVCQLGFLPGDGLLFASDSEHCDFWSLFQYRQGKDDQITDQKAELGEAHWVFGQRRWQYVGDDTVIGIETTGAGDQIVEVDLVSKELTVLQQGFAACNHLSYSKGELLFVGRYSDRQAEILSLRPSSGSVECIRGSDERDSVTSVSQPKSISFPTRDKGCAHGYFYLPFNAEYTGPAKDKPPLMVLVHGGPTSRATSEWSALKQYFVSLGYALLDINHRGSTGHGRRYRQRLLGNWGEVDASDIMDGVQYVIGQGWVDRSRIFIRGSSAGGYAVLRALTRYADQFAGGACYYGIGNLITLAEITHKFEGKYTDRLIGEAFDPDLASQPESQYVQRSPVFEMHRLNSPLILFQGLDDKVVPPAVSQEVVDILKEKGLKYEYVEYQGEGHGFRLSETRIDSLTREIQFFSDIIRNKEEVQI